MWVKELTLLMVRNSFGSLQLKSEKLVVVHWWSIGGPLECKQLSRDIANYDEDNWRQVAKNMCQEGIVEKFKQNPSLGETLLNTGNKKLVECSFDKFWGTGVTLSNRNCLDKRLWVNDGGILGEMLMEIRASLKNDNNNIQAAEPELMEATTSNETT